MAELRKLKEQVKKTKSDVARNGSFQREPTMQEIIAAEYEWFAAVLDRICLIGSLGSVLALALGVTVIGQIMGAGLL